MFDLIRVSAPKAIPAQVNHAAFVAAVAECSSQLSSAAVPKTDNMMAQETKDMTYAELAREIHKREDL